MQIMPLTQWSYILCVGQTKTEDRWKKTGKQAHLSKSAKGSQTLDAPQSLHFQIFLNIKERELSWWGRS